MNEILIYGDIGYEVQAKDIVTQLNKCEGPLDVRIDSNGGDVYAGISIMNALRRYPDVVTVYVDGIAASAASYIAVGGADRLVMSPNSALMVHGAWTNGAGNSFEFAEIAANLAQITENIAGIYAEKSGQDAAYWLEVMKKDTTYSAEQAVEVGLADEVAESVKSVAAQQRQAVMAAKRSRFAESKAAAGVPEIVSRSATPPTAGSRSESAPENITPSDGQKGDTLSIQNLAQELGVEPDVLREKLSGFFNEAVAVAGEVEVTYPAETPIAPTERVTVEPVIGDQGGDAAAEGETPTVQNAATAPLGLTFAIGSTPDEWDVTVDESTGVVTAKAPNGAEVGETVEVVVKVNDSTDVACTFKVKAVSEDTDDGEQTTDPASTKVPAAPGNTAGQVFVDVVPRIADNSDVVMVPKSVWDEYVAERAKNQARIEAEAQRELESKIDGHIRDGRYSAAHRGEALAAYKHDPETAEKTWGSLPMNKAVPVAEIGHSGAAEKMSKADELVAKARANRKNKENK